MVKVLLGDNPECKLDNCIPSRSGLKTVLEVLKIQMTFWPTLESSFTKLQSQWGGSCSFENISRLFSYFKFFSVQTFLLIEGLHFKLRFSVSLAVKNVNSLVFRL